jgi:carboxymethylenebutenolidase
LGDNIRVAPFLGEEERAMTNLRSFSVALVLAPVLAGPVLAEVKTSLVTIKSGDELITGFLAVPEGSGPFPALVVIQEWWGLNDWIKENAKRMAEKGYVALAPDLYRGKVTANPKVAKQLLGGLPKDRALRDLKGAIDFLSANKHVQKGKIGSIGWCMGGGFSLRLAVDDDRVVSCVMCYGGVIDEANKLKSMQARILGIFGEEDKGIPAKSVRGFESALKEAGRAVERIHIFDGAGHGFMRPNNGKNPNPAYREAQAREAWDEIDAFFVKTLKK